MINLGGFGGPNSYALGINDRGQIVGRSQTPQHPYYYDRAFLYANEDMRDLGTLGGASAWATAINNSGQIAGFSATDPNVGAPPGASHAYLLAGGIMRDLGTLTGRNHSFASGINDSGQVVGDSNTGSGNRAFLCSGSALLDLNSLIPPGAGWVLGYAHDINNHGQIVVSGGIQWYDNRAFLLTPHLVLMGGNAADSATPNAQRTGIRFDAAQAAPILSQGMQAPGVNEGIFFSNYSDPQYNSQRKATFLGSLIGLGVDEANDEGVWTGTAGSLELLARKGDGVPGSDLELSFGGFREPLINTAGEVAFAGLLEGSGVDEMNDQVIWCTVAGALNIVARTSLPAPGTTVGVSYADLSAPVLNGGGELAFLGELTGAGVDGTNDVGIWKGAPGAWTLVARTGAAAAGMDAGVVFSGLNAPALNDSGDVAFVAYVTGSGVEDENDSAIWAGAPGALQLALREGAQAAGANAVLEYASFERVLLTGAGQVVFSARLRGVGVDASNDVGIWVVEPDRSVRLVARTGALFDAGGGVLRIIASLQLFSSAGNEPGFDRSGLPALTVFFTDASRGMYSATMVPAATPPVITTQPQSRSAPAGGGAILSVAASALSPVSYQWRFNGADIAGANGAELSLGELTFRGGGTYSVAVSNALGTVLSSPAVLEVTPSRFVDWQAVSFPDHLGDPSKSGPDADFDGDSLSNLLEYATGLDPRSPDISGLLQIGIEAEAEQNYVTLTYRQRIGATDVTYKVGVSDTLSEWDYSESTIEQLGEAFPDDTGLSEEVTVRLALPMSATRQTFLRLKVEHAP